MPLTDAPLGTLARDPALRLVGDSLPMLLRDREDPPPPPDASERFFLRERAE